MACMIEKNGISEKDVIGLINAKFKELYESLESLWSSIEGAIEVSHGSLYRQLEILDFKINALMEKHDIEVDYEAILKRSESIKDRVEKLFRDCKGDKNAKSV